MLRWVKWISIFLAGLSGLSLLVAWLVLSSSFLAQTRGDLTARLLTRELGQVVDITGGVVVDIGLEMHVTADGLTLPSQTMGDVTLARVEQVEFNVALRDLLRGRITLSDFQIAGASILLVVDQDGTSSWSGGAAKPARAADVPVSGAGNGENLVSFLAGHRIQVSKSGVTYRDARNGLDLDLLLTSLDLSQSDRAAPLIIRGQGTLNGQELSLTGSFPPEQPFQATAALSQMRVTLNGTPDAGGYGAGYSVAMSANIAELGQLLDVLKLNKTISGTGTVSAVFKKSPGSARIDDLNMLVLLKGGQSLELTADLGELGDPSDISIDTKIRLYSKADMPPATKMRTDLKLTRIDMQLLAQPDGIPTRRMVIATNGFVLDTGGVGPPPISFSQISRTPDGLLRIGKLELRIGPPQAPFLVLDGALEDALQLQGIDVNATLALPMASLFGPELFQDSDVLGQVSGGFRLTGDSKILSLSNLNAVSQGTDLWDLKVSGSMGNALKFSDVSLDIAADIPSGAAVLKALDLKPIETGPVKLNGNLSSRGPEWQTKATIAVAQSQLGITLDVDYDPPNSKVRGVIDSDLVKVDQLRAIGAAVSQLARLNEMEKAASQAVSAPDSPQEVENPDAAAPKDAEQPQAPGPFRDVTLRPLGRAILLSGMDLNLGFDLRKIEGKNNTGSLKGDLELKDQMVRLGPVKFEYGKAYFDLEGSMNLIDAPDVIKLSGSTGGWNFGKIMQELKFKKRAKGVISARFDVSAGLASVRDFLGTMTGSATVSMANGSIDSQLLDIAGLGVIPWLFSKERGPTVTIVCIRAPLQFSQGRISTKRGVIETDRVQIVVLGDVNLNRQTLDIMGQPRRIGKPLSRSPWPFTAVGPIAKPKIKVKKGPRRLRRSDGATTMPQRRKLCVPDILQLK